MAIRQPRFNLATFPVKETIVMVTCLLEKITQANDSLCLPKHTCFHAHSVPSIDIQSYLNRIAKYCPCANECFLSLLVYFDRATAQSKKLFTIDSYNIHRLIISGIMVASKFFSDVFFTNTRYAKVGGLPVEELNLLELEFLRMNNFNIYVSVEELQQYGNQLLMHSVKEDRRRQRRELSLYNNNNDLYNNYNMYSHHLYSTTVQDV